ncbi:Retrovirus-related Pol polyprotein from type-2 retrotransposable element R2DM [Sesamum angolense]|uniref:Retrovirus-related Pol polyprotein from type-2 retrotransposable element R2DM n=1 Tax=Sesamum angolense TaxID=2727404 RepID=A0AAE1T9V2_9LAMI|nr:Retrovirus-related Pol polyprotein from type-2 retrotransposable element R2DM [Sesamum angolense]
MVGSHNLFKLSSFEINKSAAVLQEQKKRIVSIKLENVLSDLKKPAASLTFIARNPYIVFVAGTPILVCRFQEILDLLISPSQNAFVPGRLISDNVLLAQELFSGYNQCRLPPRCALKVDLRKAYDTVEWDFLFATLRLFGFPAVFIRWIEECVTSAHYSVVVNGGVHGFFAGARGLRQGDPMSPYLFVLVMEVLQMILQQFIDQDGQFLYHWRCMELKLFQLSFADDLLLLCKADVQSAASGLRDSLLETLGFQEGHLPVRYLGLPLISARLSIADYQPLLQKIDSRIKGWEGVQLSFAGRVQLIKSVLVSLEVYWAMAFILPKGIIKEMIKRLRTFLWKGTSSSGYPKVAWEIVCRPVEEGGQGIKDIFALNRALMSKHLWAVIKQVRTSIWVDWIFQVRLRDCSIWTAKDNKDDKYRTLDKLSVVMKDGQWNWPMITDIACLEITYMFPPISEGQDRISWKSNDGSFNTSTAYDLFRQPGPKVVWSSLLLGPFKIPKNCFILWLAIMGNCPHWINHGFTTQTVTAFCVRMEP